MLTEMPLPNGTGYSLLCFFFIVVLVVIYFVVEHVGGSGAGRTFLWDMAKSIAGWVVDAPFVYIKVAIGFAILKWLGWI